MTQDEVYQERYENSPERYNEPSHIHEWTDEMREEAKLRAVERKRQKDAEQELLQNAEDNRLTDNEVREVAKMQKLIDSYEQNIVVLWGKLRSMDLTAELPNSDYTEYIQKIWRFLDFVTAKHPEIIKEWLNNR